MLFAKKRLIMTKNLAGRRTVRIQITTITHVKYSYNAIFSFFFGSEETVFQGQQKEFSSRYIFWGGGPEGAALLAFGLTFGNEFDGSVKQTGEEQAHSRADESQRVGTRHIEHLPGNRGSQ